MARTTGPLGSVDASGTLADKLTFAKWKGRTYVRSVPLVKAARAPSQASSSAMMQWLAKRWAIDLSAADQATWQPLAEPKNVPPFNAYLSYNLERWGRFLAPSTTYPAPGGGSGAIPFPTLTAIDGVGQITIEWTVPTPNDAWGFAIHRDPTSPITPDRNNLVHVGVLIDPGTHRFVDRPLQPGSYTYVAQQYLTTGAKSFSTSNVTANAT